MDAHLRAGVAIFNAGGYHAAHDAWEDRWLDLASGADDERFLHGLIQYTAAIHHAQGANWAGVRGLSESASDYLDGLPTPYRGVDLDPVRDYLDELGADPEHVDRVPHPPLRVEGAAIQPADLDFEAAAVAAGVLAEERDAYDEAVIDAAVGYARETAEPGGSDRFVALVMDFVAEDDRRDIVYDRLRGHVERRQGREGDVDGLFE